MIYVDAPRKVKFQGRLVTTCHALSGQQGAVGTQELEGFARKIGSKAEWIQHRGEAKEHLDIIGIARLERVFNTDVKMVNVRMLVTLIKNKRMYAIGKEAGELRLWDRLCRDACGGQLQESEGSI